MLWDDVKKPLADDLAAATAKVNQADKKKGLLKTAVNKQKKYDDLMADFHNSRHNQAPMKE